MNLKELIALTGMPGIYKMAGSRKNGLFVEDLDTGKIKFAPTRKYQFTPLESIAIYTENDDTASLEKVFQNMLDQSADNPPANPSASAKVLRDYFSDVLPTHDEDRVHISDIKKVIKWYNFLDKRGYLTAEPEVEEAEVVEEAKEEKA